MDITNNKLFWGNLNQIRRNDADLFYFTISQTKGGNLRDLIILKLLRMQHKKCLIHLHGGYYRQLVNNDLSIWQRRENYKAISYLDGVIVLGESLKPIFQGVSDEKKIFVVPNCVDNEYLMSDREFEEKISFIEKRSVKHVLYLNNFIRPKGYPEVLEMARLEKERVENGDERKLHFDFAGRFFEDSEKKFFFNYIERHRLDDYVTYHGIVSGDEKRMLLKKCDIFVLLTHYPNEGQPISILEAMGNGMLVVTTNHAGIPDLIQDRETEIVVNGKIEKELMQDIVSLDISVIINGYNKVKERYTQKMYIQNMKKIMCVGVVICKINFAITASQLFDSMAAKAVAA